MSNDYLMQKRGKYDSFTKSSLSQCQRVVAPSESVDQPKRSIGITLRRFSGEWGESVEVGGSQRTDKQSTAAKFFGIFFLL